MARKATAGLATVLAFGTVACVLYGLGGGLRGDIGILLGPLAAYHGLAYGDVSLCIAVMQLVFGASQPLFGILATRRSNRFVLLVGVALFLASFAGMALFRGMMALMLSLGVLFGLGAGALSFGLILTSAIHFVGPERAMLVSGMLNAAAGAGCFVLSPALQGMLGLAGTQGTLLALMVPFALLLPVALLVTSHDADIAEEHAPDGIVGKGHSEPAVEQNVLAPFQKAFRNRTFLLLVAGFSTCGFHMVIIESHLFNQLVLDGIDASAASWAFSLYGIATIAGALLSGWLSTRFHKGRLLGFYYGFRAIWVAAYLLLMPKSLPFAVLFVIGLGMTGDATVSPTSGLVNREFDLAYVATLIGVLFFCHQIGAFFSAWLGGVLLEATGGYAAVWSIDIALCAFACVMSLMIKRSDNAR